LKNGDKKDETKDGKQKKNKKGTSNWCVVHSHTTGLRGWQKAHGRSKQASCQPGSSQRQVRQHKQAKQFVCHSLAHLARQDME
jgi:hypothetical protein